MPDSDLLLFMPHNPGDVVMALHVAAEWRRRFPAAPIDFITGEECRDLVGHVPMLRAVSALPGPAWRGLQGSGNFSGAVQAVSQWITDLENLRYGLAVNLFQGRLGGLVQSFVSADRKIGLELKDGSRFEFGSRVLEHLAAVPAQREGNPFHAVDLYRLAVAEALGLPWNHDLAQRPIFDLPPSPAPFPHRGFLLLHPGAAFPGKRWPAVRWIRLAQLCLAAGERLVFTGSAEEKNFVGSIVAALPSGQSVEYADLSGATTLRSVAALCGAARQVVCGDTAVMHLAAAVGTPVLALFGPSNPVETGPYGLGHRVIQTRFSFAADLHFEDPCPELEALPAEAVADLLLHDSAAGLPAGSVWRTDWDMATGMQILRDRLGRLHPFQTDMQTWLRVLTHPPAAAPETALGRALDAAQSSPNRDNLNLLEKEERRWAEQTGTSLVWEAYRIALNGLPVLPLPRHLHLRAQRWRRACGETGNLHIVSQPSMG